MMQRNMYESLQKALVEARQSKGLTQTEIATRLGKPQSFVSKYESGERRLDVVEFLEVCQALSVKPNSILNKIDIDNA
jgi:transcriptional regulator with XRE-family HTH domain